MRRDLATYFETLDWKSGPIVWVPTAAITRFLPTSQWSKRELADRKTRFVWDGDWDLASRPLDRFGEISVSFRSVFQIFRDGVAPERSDEYAEKLALLAQQGRSARGNDREGLDQYFRSIRELHDDLATNGYRLQSALGGSPHDEIGVFIDRDGQLLKAEDKFCGTHRFALAIQLGIEQIPVRISAIHPSWASSSKIVPGELAWSFHDGIELRFPEGTVTPRSSRMLRRLTNAVKFATLRKPLPYRSNYSTHHLAKGSAYHARFVEKRGRALMWTMEKAFLEQLVTEHPPQRVLDVATGTGRISGWLKSLLPAASVHGVDNSESMLAVAKQNWPDVNFHVVDLMKPLPAELGQFDLITAFRFFPNADDTLRAAAMRAVAGLLAPGGRVVFNNHRNFWSASYIAKRITGRSAEGATNDELLELFASVGLRPVASKSIGLWPQSEDDSYLLPWAWTAKLEELNANRFATKHRLGYNTIFVLQKT